MSMLGQVRSQNERAMSIQQWGGVKALDELNDIKEISGEDSFADDLESVKGDIQGTDDESGVQVAKNVETDQKEETKESKQQSKEESKQASPEEVKQAPVEKLKEDLDGEKPILNIEVIPDWKERFETYDYTQEQRDLV